MSRFRVDQSETNRKQKDSATERLRVWTKVTTGVKVNVSQIRNTDNTESTQKTSGAKTVHEKRSIFSEI